MIEYYCIKDSAQISVTDKEGKVKYTQCIDDLITNAGFAAVAGLLLIDVGGTAFDYLAIGTGTISATITDTTLGTEVSRKAATGTRVTIAVANDTAQWVVSFSSLDAGCDGTLVIAEFGIFNHSSAGTMLCRQVTIAPDSVKFTPDGDTINLTMRVQIKQGA